MSEIWNRHVKNGEAFSAENFIIPGGGLVGNIQLFNPLAAPVPKRIRLRSFHVTSTVALGASVNRHDVGLATLGLPAGFIVENMLGGGAAEVAEMRSAAAAAPGLGAIFWQVSAAGGEPALYPPGGREWGFDLLPGQGINVAGAAGAVLIVNWQWVEVPL